MDKDQNGTVEIEEFMTEIVDWISTRRKSMTELNKNDNFEDP